MTLLVPLALLGWIPAVLLLFAVLPARRAVIVAFLVAWLFLPVAGYSIAGLPDYTKMSATCAGVLLATIVFDPDRLRTFRPHWADVPMASWCVVPLASSVSNGLGVYDGLSASLNHTITWGLPYFIGRLYFHDERSLRELATGILIGGLIYVPLCLYEIRMSPQLHRIVYGFTPAWHNVHRGGGWRPMVFMKDGLMLGMWMTTASLVGAWLWHAGGLKRVLGVPASWLVAALLVTTVLCRSFGALALLALGLSTPYLARRWKTALPVLTLALAPIAYMGARTVGGWSAGGLLELVSQISEERAGSLQTRLENENILAAHALQRPMFGWGGWGRNRPPVDEAGHTITDGLWIIALGINGVVGLASLYAWLLIPPVVLWRRFPAAMWSDPRLAAPVALAMLSVLYAIDNLFNNMPNPIFILVAGAVTALCTAPRCRVAPVSVASPGLRDASGAGVPSSLSR
jgi:hypothetical protein